MLLKFIFVGYKISFGNESAIHISFVCAHDLQEVQKMCFCFDFKVSSLLLISR